MPSFLYLLRNDMGCSGSKIVDIGYYSQLYTFVVLLYIDYSDKELVAFYV